MTGCRKDAKNTLDKNYLYFAKKFGTRIIPESKVIDIRPLSADGSMIPANLGVNPALSITALSERAMSFIPVKPSGKMQYLQAEKNWGVTDLLSLSESLTEKP